MATGLSSAGPGYLLGEACRGLCWGDVKAEGLGTCRVPARRSQQGCVCLDLVTVPSFSKSLTAAVEYPTTNPGFNPACPPTAWSCNSLPSCTVGHTGFVVQEAECQGRSRDKRGGVLGAPHPRAPRSHLRISFNIDFPSALKPLAKPLLAGRDVVSSLSGHGEGQKVLLEGC